MNPEIEFARSMVRSTVGKEGEQELLLVLALKEEDKDERHYYIGEFLKVTDEVGIKPGTEELIKDLRKIYMIPNLLKSRRVRTRLMTQMVEGLRLTLRERSIVFEDEPTTNAALTLWAQGKFNPKDVAKFLYEKNDEWRNDFRSARREFARAYLNYEAKMEKADREYGGGSLEYYISKKLSTSCFFSDATSICNTFRISPVFFLANIVDQANLGFRRTGVKDVHYKAMELLRSAGQD